ncbi:MFS transporter [Streptomyces olivochromogenes]|uniref:MFS transporter n=1 Tax=Streptomyces olivochromogenes TaxID=1963 RepID=UPI001F1E8603|nr:MFS transporter [Streptomyces olivochromogenes]MCF3135800.1 MFS transporter [Streptomyces olivochromogenes]
MPSTPPAVTSPGPPTARAPGRPWAAVLVLAAATFSVVTTEMLPVGLLTSLAADLRVTTGGAGLALTLPGLVAAVGALLLPVAVRGTDRRTVLCALLLLLAAADLLSALAPALPVLLAARVLVGVCIGGVWAVAAGLAVRLVPTASVGRATALIFSGIAVASVLGVPVGTFLGSVSGWRWAFAGTAACALAVAGCLAVVLPPLPAERPVLPSAFVRLLRAPRLGLGLVTVALLVTGHFTAYTYVRPLLERVPGTGPALVSTLLLAYGVAGIAGNFAGGTLAARDPRRALLVLSAALGTAVLLLVFAADSLPASTALLVSWGLAYGGVSVSAQTWLSTTAPHSREAGSALFAGVFNTAIALGAFTGGRLTDGPGPTAVLCLGAGLALLAAAVAAYADRTADGR